MQDNDRAGDGEGSKDHGTRALCTHNAVVQNRPGMGVDLHQQESPANAKGTRDSSASAYMKAHCEQM